MISCEKAEVLSNKKQYGEASSVESVLLRLHLLICKSCAAYSKKDEKLTELFDKGVYHQLTEEEKDQIKERLRNFSLEQGNEISVNGSSM